MSLSTKEGPGGFRKEFLSRSFKELSFWGISVSKEGKGSERSSFQGALKSPFWSVSVNQGGPRGSERSSFQGALKS